MRIPAAYCLANVDTPDSSAEAAVNCTMGWSVLGSAEMAVSIVAITSLFFSTRAANSSVRPAVSAAVGASPVSSSHSMASGCISVPDLYLVNTFWHSGMERPRKRMPSSESRSDGSYTMVVTPRVPA